MPLAPFFVACLTLGALDPYVTIDPSLLKPAPQAYSKTAQAALFIAGGVSAFVAHEAGHVAVNLALGNRPELEAVWGFGFVPFFAISPALSCSASRCIKANGKPFPAGPRGKFAIVTAGFEMQHLTSEIILSLDPYLRQHHAPLRKGWLAFNIGLSVAYALASVLNIEDSHGDAGGAAYLLRVPRPLMAAYLVAPAAMDLYRYLDATSPWAPSVSRSLKVGFLSLLWTF